MKKPWAKNAKYHLCLMANDVFHFTCFKLGHVSLAVVVYMKYFSLPSFDTFHTKCYLKVITRALFIKNMEHVFKNKKNLLTSFTFFNFKTMNKMYI